jgi:predicted amidohydrolase
MVSRWGAMIGKEAEAETRGPKVLRTFLHDRAAPLDFRVARALISGELSPMPIGKDLHTTIAESGTAKIEQRIIRPILR